jgi:hypothetical protein
LAEACREAYAGLVLGLLRFISLVNAAVWLGAGVFFTLGVGQAVFSDEMKRIFGKYYVGIIAQHLIGQYFLFHIVCGCIALAHLLFEVFYLRRSIRRWVFAAVIVPLCLGLLGAFVFQPRMRTLYQAMYLGPVEQRAAAQKQFGMMHGLSQTMNLASVILVVAYLWRLGNPPETPRFVSSHKFRG